MAGPGPGSGLTLTQLVTRVKTEATFAESDATIKGWLNEKHKQGAVRAGLDKRLADLATSVVDQAVYDLPAGIADLRTVRIDGKRHNPSTLEDVWDLQNGDKRLTTFRFGVFAPYYGSDGTPQFVVYPTPSNAGLGIQGLAVYTPADLTDPDGFPIWPEDLQEHIADGAIALGLRLRLEDAQEAQVFEDRFNAAVQEMERRLVSRVGSGPVQVGVMGRHW